MLEQSTTTVPSVACPEYQLELDKAHLLDLNRIFVSDRLWEVVKIAMRVSGHLKERRWEAGRTVMLRFGRIIRRRFKGLQWVVCDL
jgi:hypothetical protein